MYLYILLKMYIISFKENIQIQNTNEGKTK